MLPIKKKWFVSKFKESRKIKGVLTFLKKKKSLELIKNKFMIDLKDNSKKKIFKLKL